MLNLIVNQLIVAKPEVPPKVCPRCKNTPLPLVASGLRRAEYCADCVREKRKLKKNLTG